ncbi:MAG TPA: excinuclease ABC subunit UvrC [Thiotrichales bacterium]|nr:excinuclease ABC subunit UvrC [Thiotrichales bacterium]
MNETSPRFDHKAFLRTLTERPGVYRMLDAEGTILYVGKARNLKKRVASYFRASGLSLKTQALMRQVASIEVTVTRTEGEALLLESNLIKAHRPRYNVLYRDDKSYPWIYVATEETYPRLAFHRGARNRPGRYFGPYPNAQAVRETLALLAKVFRVRQCEDSVFNNRSRPCLQHQIERCSAPCVGLISPEAYARDLQEAMLFLEGRNDEIIERLGERMQAAAEALAFEEAARYRDRIATLRRIQEKQYITGERGDLDIVALAMEAGVAVVQVFFVRGGRNLGNKTFQPAVPEAETPESVMEAFLSQFYSTHPPPAEILVNRLEAGEAVGLLEAALGERAGRRVRIRQRVRGERARWLEMAERNARTALASRLASRSGMRERLEALRDALALEALPERMECFDISHTRGEATVASCVVFDAEGPRKSDYRRFNIEGITPGDDYAAMRQALERRYRRIRAGEAPLPDVLFIDGGKGQLAMAREVLDELGIPDVTLVGIAKGPERRPGLETLFVDGRAEPVHLKPDSRALHLIQQIRDEAHRFAITGHRQRRQKQRTRSPLESIPGVGARRRQRLLTHFGGLQEVARAGVEDLMRVKGISRRLAEQIHAAFHGEELR